MNHRLGWWGLVMAIVVVGIGESASAHLRDYLVNQPYYTTKQGEFEVEVWTDFNLPEADNDDTYSVRQQYEFEYGLTNRWQLAYYEVFKWDRRDDFERDMFKVETKYRFLEAGVLPLDIALYGEYKNPNGRRDRRSDEVEGKLILSRDVGAWNVITNLIAEKAINTHSDWEFAYTLGASYGVTPRVRLGLELKETLGDSDAFGIRRKDHKLQLIPGVYANLTPHLRILFGPAFGLTRASDDLQLRSIIEWEF